MSDERTFDRADELTDDELVRHVDFDGISCLVPPPNEGGQGKLARAFGVSRRSIVRWKRNGRIPFFSADRALTRLGEHPIAFWPEAFGLPKPEARPRIPEALMPKPAAPAKRSRPTVYRPRLRRRPQGTIGDSTTRVLGAVIELSRCGTVTYNDLMERTGLARGTIQRHLVDLREAGLVDWKDNAAGTLRPTVKLVRFGHPES